MNRFTRPASSARSPDPLRASASTARAFGPKDWLFVVALLTAVVLVYEPAWQGRFIWDDEAHVTSPELRSWYGLCRIWFDLKATQQYYPLLHSAFWFEHKLWGDATLGYHLVNILLHATAALLVALILRRLKIPGAYLAAAIFALHPVHVESVAWITEQKNTLSAVFYLAAAMVYLHFDQTRKMPSYYWAFGLFVLGLLSKTVTATLPAALLLIFWWQRARLSWRRDVLPLVPFFVLGAAAGLFTAWVERKLIGAEGAAYDLTLVERCLIAGRVIWFYLGKLLWPAELVFIYPRWQMSQAVWWQYLFPLATFLLLAALWAVRRRWRGPLAGLLFFAGTLFPVLGFFNVFPFVYSYVADHFQYMASLGIITLAAAAVALLLRRRGLWERPAGYAACLVLLATLGSLTWQQSGMYTDIDTLYRTTIDRNPACWMAYNNLGNLLHDRGQTDDAIAMFRKAIEIKPDYVKTYNNLGLTLAGRGQIDEAMAEYRKALKIQPDCATAYYNLGLALIGRGQVDDAMAEYRKALEIDPNYSEAHNNLGLALRNRGQLDDAMAEYRKALEANPENAVAYSNLGNIFVSRGQVDEAIVQYRKALEVSPGTVEFRYNLAQALSKQGRLDETMAEYEKALEIKPDYAEAHNNLGVVLVGRGRLDEAMVHFQTALKTKPDYTEARNNLGIAQSRREEIGERLAGWRESLRTRPDDVTSLNETAWTLATNPNASIRNGAEAVELARRAVQLSDASEPAVLGTLAAAYAEAGRFSEAVQTARKAAESAMRQNNRSLAESIKAKIPLYQAKTAFRETLPPSVPRSAQP